MWMGIFIMNIKDGKRIMNIKDGTTEKANMFQGNFGEITLWCHCTRFKGVKLRSIIILTNIIIT